MSNKLVKEQGTVGKTKKKSGMNKKYIKPIIVGAILVCIFIGAVAALVLSDSGSDVSGEKIVQYEAPEKGDTVAEIYVKDYGVIKVRFFDSVAPKAVENFVTHAEEGYYDGVSFHRVIENFMVQSGDPTGTGSGGESIWGDTFEDEFSTSLMPVRGALCMANTGNDDTNGSQFFIVTKKDYSLEYAAAIEGAIDSNLFEYFIENGGAAHLYGEHTVFGQVYEGLDIADAISEVTKDSSDRPDEDIIIEKIVITTYGGEAETESAAE